ncbi:MAG TPA: cation:proton antiporter [Dermatophilaceae bacterium]|nr:cation:proton antiporter [Dermatophilaceae bacterium]
MDFAMLALVVLAGLVGPLLAVPRAWHMPVVVGELLVGIILGRTGLGYLDASEPTFSFLGEVGFGLVMFVVGSHVPVRDVHLRQGLGRGTVRAVLVGAGSVALGVLLAAAFGTGHAALYAVLMASSSAALILPIIDSLGLGGEQVLQLLPQIAIADAACIVAVPLAIDPAHAGRAALGALAVILSGVAIFALLSLLERKGLRHRLHRLSEQRHFALELRISLVILFSLSALATRSHVSIMLAGFVFGLALTAVGPPRRLARQLFAVTEGFFGPLFFVWLGASLDLRALGSRPGLILLGLLLGVGAVLSHSLTRLTGQPLSLSSLASAQLGVPVAAATVGTSLNILQPGEPAALVLGALVTIAAATIAGGAAVRQGNLSAAEPKKPMPT